MSSRSVSPGGALLRASRIFSIPPPLPRAAENSAGSVYFASDTATAAHPTHLSITTPQSSLARGDWGLKRPLPKRTTTRTSTPVIRIGAIDTYEKVTEFASAADHSLTLKKWQDMGVALTVPPKTKRQQQAEAQSNFVNYRDSPLKSVFEANNDAITPEEKLPGKTDVSRWKFSGPWLAGLTEGEFAHYVLREVRHRKVEFRAFLRQACAKSATDEAERRARGEGQEAKPPVRPEDISEAEFMVYLKSLRDERSELYEMIRKFLDIAPPPNGIVSDTIADLIGRGGFATPMNAQDVLPVSTSPYADTGPPKTHPSAGLSYARSNSHLFNHPVHGPQKQHAPVQARIVQPKHSKSHALDALLGVGGFVVNTPEGSPAFETHGGITNQAINRYRRPDLLTPGLLSIEPNKFGGSKAWVVPKDASIDPKGRVILRVSAADADTVAVKEGTTDQIPDRMESALQGFAPRSGLRDPAVINSDDGYGLSAGDFRRPHRYSPFRKSQHQLEQ